MPAPVPDRLLRAKAAGFVDAISKMGDAERSEYPKGFMGKDYNELRRQVLSAHPDWEQLLPPEVRILAVTAECRYADLMIMCSQIVAMLESGTP